AKACLAADREQRPRRGEDVARAVDAYQVGVQERLRAAELEQERTKVRRSEGMKYRPLVVLAVVVWVFICGGAGYFIFWGKKPRRAWRRGIDNHETPCRSPRRERATEGRRGTVYTGSPVPRSQKKPPGSSQVVCRRLRGRPQFRRQPVNRSPLQCRLFGSS